MKPVLLLQNCPAESPGTILDYLRQRSIDYQHVRTYNVCELPSVDNFGTVINLGCPHSASDYHDHEYLTRLFALVCDVVRRDIPYLGVCFGAQLLARALGAEVRPNSVKEIGVYTVRVTDAGVADPLFSQLDREIEVVQWHGDTFRVPFNAQLLVEGDDCTNQAFRKGNMIGLQFHLEVDANEITRWCNEYSTELTEFGLTSDDLIHDTEQLSDNMRTLNFRMLDGFFGR
ncbi:MAG: type 1 glutamine amidotransferase [Candidatus Zixiibacteriota bacterium]